MSKQSSLFPENYDEFLRSLKDRIRQAQVRAALAVNSEMVMLYWYIGREILQRQEAEGWGAKVIDQLSKDLKREFPDNTGFSSRNLKYMRSFAEAWPEEIIVQQAAAQIPWFHNCILLDKVKSREQRIWYIQKTVENGWSRNILAMQIETNLYQRQGGATTTFSRTLPSPQSDLAQQIVKDPYHLQFLTLDESVQERELEAALVSHIQAFLLELGVGFAFVGRQYQIEVGGEDFYIDLLFYHLKLRCYVVIELKTKEFRPEDTGQLNFYLSAVDNLLRHSDDQPTIGILLCRSKNQQVAEFALQDVNKPIGVASYLLRDSLPTELQASLPTIEQLELEVAAVVAEVEGAAVEES
jgi:predicted nuclease of restriction endonuclease-like (RecB) superfamily